MTTCAECRYHHDRGCYIAPVSQPITEDTTA